MKSDEWVLAVDCGTQSLKALVFDTSGQLLAKAQVAFEPYFSNRPGWAEQDPQVFWKALCRACHMLWQEKGVAKKDIVAMSLTTQRSTVINVDQEGSPLRPAIVWMDQRKTHGLPPVGGLWGMGFKIIGQSKTVDYLRAEAEANWIATYQADVWDQTHKFLLLSGYLTYRLTGEFVDSVAAQVGYLPFDFRRHRWAANWNWKWRILPLRRSMLPDLQPPGNLLGHISGSAADQTGLPPGLPLIAAAADKACEVIGSGAIDSSVGCLSYGTTATINVTHRRYIEPICLLPAYPAAVPNHYSMEVQVYRGYWMVNWFKEEFGHPEQVQALRNGETAEMLFERLLEEVKPGAMGLMVQPYWTPGLKSPGPEAKGAVIGFGDVHTRAHLYRAILEGLAYALREGSERIEKRSRTPITSLRVSGGGSQSPLALQLTADIFGLPTVKPHLYETAGLGAAIDAAVGAGLFADFKSAVAAMTHVGEVYQPDPNFHRQYDRLYREVYKKMYRRLKPLYEKIRLITGYPE
jgi:sugar (pentulose or hexulose) kinase